MIPALSEERLHHLASETARLEANGYDGAFHNDQDTADIMGTPILWGRSDRLPLLLYPDRMEGEGSLVTGQAAIHGEILIEDIYAGLCVIHQTSFEYGEMDPVMFDSFLEAARAGWRID